MSEITKNTTYRKKPIPKALKIAVWNKNIGETIGKHKCLCCNISDITQMKFHCGHIKAEVNGGSTDIDNLLPICESCNKSMGKKNLNEFKKILKVDKVNDNKLINLIEKMTEYSILSRNHDQNNKIYQALNDTYSLYFSINDKNSYGNIYQCKKCNENLLVPLPEESVNGINKKKNFLKVHTNCLKTDSNYYNFLEKRGYLI